MKQRKFIAIYLWNSNHTDECETMNMNRNILNTKWLIIRTFSMSFPRLLMIFSSISARMPTLAVCNGGPGVSFLSHFFASASFLKYPPCNRMWPFRAGIFLNFRWHKLHSTGFCSVFTAFAAADCGVADAFDVVFTVSTSLFGWFCCNCVWTESKTD